MLNIVASIKDNRVSWPNFFERSADHIALFGNSAVGPISPAQKVARTA